MPFGELATRKEHLAACKERALEYVERGELANALQSMWQDLRLHPETANHSGIRLGSTLLVQGHLNTPDEVRRHITSFH
jgi:hypothetical protein